MNVDGVLANAAAGTLSSSNDWFGKATSQGVVPAAARLSSAVPMSLIRWTTSHGGTVYGRDNWERLRSIRHSKQRAGRQNPFSRVMCHNTRVHAEYGRQAQIPYVIDGAGGTRV